MLHTINIIVHIAAGLIAMLIGIVPYLSAKGGTKHRRYGRLFLGFMAIVLLTALNGVIFFVDRPFLTVVTMQSFYFSYSGYRVLKMKTSDWQWFDLLVSLLVLAVGISFIIRLQSANVLWDISIVYYLLAYLFLVLSIDLLRMLIPGSFKHPKFWLYDHIFKMTGAFTALVSAGIGTVLAAWAPYNQIIPASLGTLWLIFCLWHFPRMLRKQSKPAKTF